jgi:RNA polymerase sigma-70 factor, ECF subfamily
VTLCRLLRLNTGKVKPGGHSGASLVVVAPIANITNDDEEARLVVRAQGDRQAFALLYRQYLPTIYRYCLRRLGSQEAAEDATSQIFMQALVALPRYQQGSFRAWLFRIARHVVIDEVRRLHPTAHMSVALSVADPQASPETMALRTDARHHLADAMALLPPAQQEVLGLRLAGLSALEIAAVLGRSHGTVRNLQHRALVRLRDLLEPIHAERGHDGL